MHRSFHGGWNNKRNKLKRSKRRPSAFEILEKRVLLASDFVTELQIGHDESEIFEIAADDGEPTFTSTAVTTATENTFYTYNITTSDPDDDVLTVTAPTIPDWLALSAVTEVDVLLHTDFSDRTVSDKTASNIIWTANGISDPGPLTAVDALLFDTPNATSHPTEMSTTRKHGVS